MAEQESINYDKIITSYVNMIKLIDKFEQEAAIVISPKVAKETYEPIRQRYKSIIKNIEKLKAQN